MKTKILCILTFCIFINKKSNSQNFIGIQQSNYSGSQGVQYNPAKLAQNKLRFSIELFGIDGTVNNSQYKLNKDSIFNGTLSYKITDTQKPVSIAAPLLEFHLPSILVAVNNKLGIGFSSNIRFFNQINEANPLLINFANSNTINLNSIENINDTKGFNMNIHALTDYGLSAGYNLIDNNKVSFSIGSSFKVYNGIGYFNFNDKGLVGQLINSTSTSPAYINVSNIDLNIATSAYDFNKLANEFTNPSNAFNSLFKKAAGNGFGGDLGAEVIIKNKFIKKHNGSHAPYKIKFGASVVDIGSVKYNNVKSLIVKGSGVLNGDSLSSYFNDITSFKNYLNKNGFTLDSTTGAKTTLLPTHLNVYADYAINSRFFVAGSALLSVVTAHQNNPYYYNQLSIAPRLETKAIEVALPITYNFMSKDIKFGIGCRFGPLYFGSGDIKLLLQNAKGGNVYAGARIAINKKRKVSKTIVSNIEIKEIAEEPKETALVPEPIKIIEEKKVEVIPVVEKVKTPEPVPAKIDSPIEIAAPVKQEIDKRLNIAAKAIQFQTAKAIIEATSITSLNEVVSLINVNKNYTLTINGYTDNTGNPNTNLLLSKNRAEAVKNYFIKKGIDEKRLIANGFGIANPIADNTTTEGKKANRRVELILEPTL